MSSRQKARLAFAAALILLAVSAISAGFAISRLSQSATWVAHTYEVQLAISRIDSVLTDAARLRFAYVTSDDASILPEFDAAVRNISSDLLHIRDLTKDNPVQETFSDQLESLVKRREELWTSSIDLKKSGRVEDSKKTLLDPENATLAASIGEVTEQMLHEEERLLGERRRLSGDLFAGLLSILVTAFVLSVVLFWLHFRLLNRELSEREAAEKESLESQESLRRLSARLMELQDEERRKFARELHDSLGQYLAVIKMNLSTLAETQLESGLLSDSIQYLEQSIAETRTLSHLLHPPLLDEVGLTSAAKWYIEGFAQRSGVEVITDFPEDYKTRLAHSVELTLFRILQESLTNIHRHSKSPKAEVSLQILANSVVLRVRDFGKGIPKEQLRHFQAAGTNVGVGLAGMRERVREQGGQLEIQSREGETTISITLPLRLNVKPGAAPSVAPVN